jgi:pimeloyl-ACP methyl ester carboxylesterase
MPTLVGVGSEDGWSTPEQNRAIANAIAGARFLTFGDSGHMAPLEAAGAVTAALEEWLA